MWAMNNLMANILAYVTRSVQRIASLRVNRNQRNARYRKCPKCGEPDFRMTDRQRARPVYGSSTYRVKWLCSNCGHQTKEYVDAPA